MKTNKSDAFTCQVHQMKRAPAKIELLGDKTKRPESAQHVIEFPGGAVEVSRTSDGSYWAHILVNRDWDDPEMDGIRGARGEVVGSRIGRTDGGIVEVDGQADVYQIAVLIKPSRN